MTTRARRTAMLRLIAALAAAAAVFAQAVTPASAGPEDIDTLAGQNGNCAKDRGAAELTEPGEPLESSVASDVTFFAKINAIATNGTGSKLYLNDDKRKRIHEIEVAAGTIRSVAGNGAPAVGTHADVNLQATDPLSTNVTGALAMGPNTNELNVLSIIGQDLVLRRFTPGVPGSLHLVATWPAPAAGSREIAADAVGNVYVARANRVWRITPAREVIDLTEDGVSIVDGVSNATALAVDAAGQNLYIGDSNANAVLRVDLIGGGTSTVMPLANPRSLAVNASGDLLFAGGGSETATEGPKVTRVQMPATTAPVSDVVLNQTGALGTGGDGGDPRLASLRHTVKLAVDATGTRLFLMNADACAVRWVPELADPETPDPGETDPPPASPGTNEDAKAPPSDTGGTGGGGGDVVPELTAPQGDPAPAPDPTAAAATGVADTNPFFSGVGSTAPEPFAFTPGPSSGFFAPAGQLATNAASSATAQAGSVTPPPMPPESGLVATAAQSQSTQTAAAGSAVPLPGASPAGTPGFASPGARPAEPAARFAMVARDSDDVPYAGLVTVALVVVGSGCAALIAAGSPGRRTQRRHRPAVGRAY